MLLAIIILIIIIIIQVLIITIISIELQKEIDKRQFYERNLRIKLKEIELKDKIIYSQRKNLKHLNKKLKKID